MRVVIAEDSVLLRAGIERLLADENIEVVAATEDGDGLLVAVSEHRPDLAIVDVRMPPSFTDEGLRAALKAREHQPGLPVLVLSQYVEERYAVELLSGGAGATPPCGVPTCARQQLRPEEVQGRQHRNRLWLRLGRHRRQRRPSVRPEQNPGPNADCQWSAQRAAGSCPPGCPRRRRWCGCLP